MIELNNLYKAEVVSIDDSNGGQDLKKGRIKVRVLPFMEGIIDISLLPWAEPLFGAGSSDEYKHCPPAVGSKVFVIVKDKAWRRIKWVSEEYIYGKFDYDSIKAKLDTIVEKDTSTYPEPCFRKFKDGSILFIDREVGQTGLYHNTGTYIFIDKNGSPTIYSKKDIKFYNDSTDIEIKNDGTVNVNSGNSINVDAGANKIEIKTTGVCNLNTTNLNLAGDETLTEAFIKGTTFITALNTLCSTISTAQSGSIAQNAAGIETIKAAFLALSLQLNTFKSTVIKGN